MSKKCDFYAIFDDFCRVVEEGDPSDVLLLIEELVLQLLEVVENGFLLKVEAIREEERVDEFADLLNFRRHFEIRNTDADDDFTQRLRWLRIFYIFQNSFNLYI